MIAGIFHQGSGLGNQLHRYVATRVKAVDLGVDFGMVATDLFKGKSFMNLDMGEEVLCSTAIEFNTGKVFVESDMSFWKDTLPYYNPDFNFIEDNTIIDGHFEDERYFEDYIPHIREWLKVEPIDIPLDVCVIGFRGGEYYTIPELGLPKEYFDRAIEQMKEINPSMKFEIHTDDEVLARKFFPDYKIISDVGTNWRAMRCAFYAIISNSSFYVLPRLLNTVSLTIAPKYWNRYNTKKWDYPQGYYKQFTYI